MPLLKGKMRRTPNTSYDHYQKKTEEGMPAVERSCFQNAKPAIIMIILQITYAIMNVITKIAINQGVSYFVMVFYRHAAATLAITPFAYLLERRTRPPLTFRIFCQIFLSALFGCTLNQNFYYGAMSYTTATFTIALSNIGPAVTFLMAIPFGLERLQLRSRAGVAKVFGTLVCVGGAMLMTLYKGIAITLWSSPFHLKLSKKGRAHEDLTKASLFVVASCISWSAWFIIQAKIGQKYAAQYSSTALMCFLAAIQAGIATLIFERHHPSVWAIHWDIKLLQAVYSGIISSAIAFSGLSWCIRKRGPLFVNMFSPLSLIVVAIISTIIFDDQLHLGSILGSILIVMGLYSVIWGKSKEMNNNVSVPQRVSTTEELPSHPNGDACGHHREASSDLEGEEESTSDRESRETDGGHIGLQVS